MRLQNSSDLISSIATGPNYDAYLRRADEYWKIREYQNAFVDVLSAMFSNQYSLAFLLVPALIALVLVRRQRASSAHVTVKTR